MIARRIPGTFLAVCAALGACRAVEPEPAAPATRAPTTTGPATSEASAPTPEAERPDVENDTFAYLLGRYDSDGDLEITAAEYTRHDGQFARWDLDGDGRLTAADWPEDGLTVTPQIMVMQRMDVLGRYFQTDENEEDVLTIDELANAFLEYDGAGTPDELLTEEEFRAQADERAVVMPGDGSMMKQNYVGEADGWSWLTSFYDLDRNNALDLVELTTIFDERDVFELRFDEIRFDDGAAGAHFEKVTYEAGLVVGSSVPDVTLAALHGDETVELAKIAGERPIALIFGSYT